MGGEMNELKPCPFCGSEAILASSVHLRMRRGRKRVKGLFWYIGCTDPECILYLDEGLKKSRLIFRSVNREFVVRRWNRRRKDEHDSEG